MCSQHVSSVVVTVTFKSARRGRRPTGRVVEKGKAKLKSNSGFEIESNCLFGIVPSILFACCKRWKFLWEWICAVEMSDEDWGGRQRKDKDRGRINLTVL
ncbi:hypothetical protein AAMO2058_001194400 [Amorphochlora amoebiformis]